MRKLRKTRILTKQTSTQPNILVFVFDSLSKNHFKRVLPLTHDYLSHKLERNVIFENFNSVGEK
jgi:hypothetical protein